MEITTNESFEHPSKASLSGDLLCDAIFVALCIIGLAIRIKRNDANAVISSDCYCLGKFGTNKLVNQSLFESGDGVDERLLCRTC